MRRQVSVLLLVGALVVAGAVGASQRDELGAPQDAASPVPSPGADPDELVDAGPEVLGEASPPGAAGDDGDGPTWRDGTGDEAADGPDGNELTPPPAAVETDEPDATDAPIEHDVEVADALDEVLADPDGLDDVGVAVAGPDGTLVYDHDADAPRLPASTQKLVAAAYALDVLGPDHRFRTSVHATGPIEDGVVDGDLVLVGGGDPVLATPRYGTVVPERPRTPLEHLARQVEQAGITEVRGRVRGDPRALPHDPEADGWVPRYLTSGNTARSSGLTVNAGRRLFERGGQLHGESADDPAREAAAMLARLLDQRDVDVGHDAARVEAGTEIPDDSEVAGVHSPPLVELLRYLVQRSDNPMTDTVWRMAAAADDDGSWLAAADGATATLEALGVDVDGYVATDGSGLSRDARVSPRQLVGLDVAMSSGPEADTWRELMAVAGESGTMRRRLVGTPAAGVARGKTGSLNDVRTFAGQVDGSEGHWHVAVMADALSTGSRARAVELIDEVLLVLTRDVQGCDPEGCPGEPRDGDDEDADDEDEDDDEDDDADEDDEG